MSLSNDRRQREERRKLTLGPPEYVLDRRQDVQRRVLDLGALSIEEWLADYPAPSGFRRRMNMITQE